MKDPIRIAPEDVYEKIKSGATLLVCAYEDEAVFRQLQIQWAISLTQFKSRLSSLPRDQEIVFY